MDINLILGIAGGLIVVAGAVKTLPYFWNMLKLFFTFSTGVEKITQIPKLLEAQEVFRATLVELSENTSNVSSTVSAQAEQINQLNCELKKYMEENKKSLNEDGELLRQLISQMEELTENSDKHAENMAKSVFKQATIIEPIAYYIVDCDLVEAKWIWKWGNTSFFNLTGLTEEQAIGGQYWDSIIIEDKERTIAAIEYAIKNGLMLDITYTNRHMLTGELTRVRNIAVPLKNMDDETSAYLGTMYIV